MSSEKKTSSEDTAANDLHDAHSVVQSIKPPKLAKQSGVDEEVCSVNVSTFSVFLLHF